MTDAEPEIVSGPVTTNPYRKPFLVLVIVICVSLLLQGFSSWQTYKVTDNTNKIVNDVDFRNSPENQAQQKLFVDQLVLRVDCNSRAAIEDALNDMALDNPGIVAGVDITSKLCSVNSPTTKP